MSHRPWPNLATYGAHLRIAQFREPAGATAAVLNCRNTLSADQVERLAGMGFVRIVKDKEIYARPGDVVEIDRLRQVFPSAIAMRTPDEAIFFRADRSPFTAHPAPAAPQQEPARPAASAPRTTPAPPRLASAPPRIAPRPVQAAPPPRPAPAATPPLPIQAGAAPRAPLPLPVRMPPASPPAARPVPRPPPSPAPLRTSRSPCRCRLRRRAPRPPRPRCGWSSSLPT